MYCNRIFGLNVRDWLYVKDHCYGILAVLEKGKVGEVYNLGGHNEKANIEIVKIILKELGKPESLITYVTDRKGHDQRYAIDPSKAMAELGWAPTTCSKTASSSPSSGTKTTWFILIG